MANDMDKHTLLLEQCKQEMDALAPQGEVVLSETVVQVEKQTRACTLEWRQAEKTVELIAKQQKSVEEARQAGENKLAAAIVEEEDAKIAVDTLARMVEDANTMRGITNTETAQILQKAGDVLHETVQRAQTSFSEKRREREETEAAIQRLKATEKAVLHTLAKAEYNSSKKMMVKIVAERRHEVCAAELEAIRLEQQHQSLQKRWENQAFLHDGIESKIAAIEEAIRSYQEEEEALQKQMQQLNVEQEREIAVALASVQQQVLQKEKEKEQLSAQLGLVQEAYNRSREEREQAFLHASQIEEASAQTISAAYAEEQEALRIIEESLAELQEQAAAYVATYNNAVARHAEVAEAADQLQQQAEAHLIKVQVAAEEEKTALDAAGTALRLAENATKIRESISSESSELLLHAQEVLMEAAASAQKLTDEKHALRSRMEQEYADIQHRADELRAQAEKAGLEVELAQVDYNQSQQLLQKETEQAELKKQEYTTAAAEIIAKAEKDQRIAREATELCLEQEREIEITLEETHAKLVQIEQALNHLATEEESERENIIQKTAIRKEEYANRQATLRRKKQQEEQEREQQQAVKEEYLQTLGTLNQEMEQISELLQVSRAKVEDIIAVGVLDIIAAEGAMSDAHYRMEIAHKAAAEVAGALQVEDSSFQFASLQAYTEDLSLADEIDTLPIAAAMTELPQAEAGDAADEVLVAEAELLAEEAMPVLEAAEEAMPEAEVEAEVEPTEPVAEADTVAEDCTEAADAVVEAAEEAAAEEITTPELFAEEEPQPEMAEDSLPEAAEAPAAEEFVMAEESDSGFAIAPEGLLGEADAVPEAEPEQPAVEEEVAVEAELPLEDAMPVPEMAEDGLPEAEAEVEAAAEPADTVAEAAAELQPEAALAEESAEPLADYADVGSLLTDFSDLTEEEIEYTQRLQVLSNAALEETMHSQSEAELDLPVKSGAAYVDWMEELARSLREEDEEPEPQVEAAAEEVVEEPVPLMQKLSKLLAMDEDDVVVQEAVVQVAEPAAEEPEMVVPVAEEAEPQPVKKRRFPFLKF